MEPEPDDEQSMSLADLAELKKTDPKRYERLMAARRERLDRERSEETGLNVAALRRIAKEELSSPSSSDPSSGVVAVPGRQSKE